MVKTDVVVTVTAEPATFVTVVVDIDVETAVVMLMLVTVDVEVEVVVDVSGGEAAEGVLGRTVKPATAISRITTRTVKLILTLSKLRHFSCPVSRRSNKDYGVGDETTMFLRCDRMVSQLINRSGLDRYPVGEVGLSLCFPRKNFLGYNGSVD